MASSRIVDDKMLDNVYFYIKVVDSITNNPVSGASIMLQDIYAPEEITDAQGRAIIEVSRNKIDVYGDNGKVYFSVQKSGYAPKDSFVKIHETGGGGYIIDDDDEDVEEFEGRYKIIALDPITGYYYYALHVKTNNGTYMTGATVKAFASINDTEPVADSEKLTDDLGRYTLISTTGGTLYFQASKTGYTASDKLAIPPSNNITDAERLSNVLTIYSSTNTNKYFSLKVINSSGVGVPNMEVGLYKDMSYSEIYQAYPAEDDRTPVLYRGSKIMIAGEPPTQSDILDEIKDIIYIITGDAYIKDHIGRDIRYSELGFTPYTITSIVNKLEEKYHISFYNTSTTFITDDERYEYLMATYPYVGDTVDYILETADFQDNSDVKYVTDSEGYIVVDTKSTSSRIIPIYGRGLSNNYIWNVRQGSLPTTTDPTNPGLILSINTGTSPSGSYNYNFQIVDSYTQKPINGATVIYMKNGSVLSTKNSNSNGLVNYTSTDSSLMVKISKDGYNEETISSAYGSTINGSYNKFELVQSNPIRVVYLNGDQEVGAKDIIVSIGYYDSQNNYIDCGKYKTESSGYIDAISSGYFSSGNNTYYAIVLNYTVTDSISASALKKILIAGGVTIVLPMSGDQGDSDVEEYVQFYDMTANAIKKNVNKGNSELSSKHMSDKVSYAGGDNYRINVLDPDSITTYDIFQSKPVMMDNNNRSVIGSIDIGLKYDINKLKLRVINRYSGYYNPIFKDILFYKNMNFNSEELPFSNVAFDYTYKDRYGKFGIINNMWFHKVNEDKSMSILNTSTPYFPLTGQYALDYRDYNIFESNWDLEHYTKQLDIDHSKPCSNISSQKNGICMFGSKYLNVPNRIEIYGLTLGDDENWRGEWNDDWITSPDACPGEVMFKEINDNSVDFYFFFTKRIHRFFYDKLKDEFEKYMNVDGGSYGKPGVEDDIREYVTKNVLKLYKLERVRVFVKRTKKGQHNSRIENDYTKYLEYDKTCDNPAIEEYFEKKGYVQYFKQHGFVEVNNVSLTKVNRDDFDRKLAYNLRNGAKEEFGFSFILTKI